ncbi:phage holin family protein [Zhihengliuella flava]|uniref:Membrane protein n=1 Tax=Zhihengliuella flava TaxID=1285193 RepID=A0A931DBM1_9MICC|nr:phage holin family protein [Zhihengliuella flava]MBG6084556.1 putative membrane protein [Zhihengliuella flava]
MMGFIVRVIVNALALAAAAWLLPGITVSAASTEAATGNGTVGVMLGYLLIGLVFGLVNAVVKPIIGFLSLPITCLTLGLFAIIINAAMLALTAWLTTYMPVQFTIDTFFWDAVLGAIIVAIVSALLGWLVPDRRRV